VRVLIVDDEAFARQRVSRLLAECGGGDVELVGEAASGQAAVGMIRSLAPDVVFLDIQMPGMSGLDVVRALEPEELPLVVFVTAFGEHAVEAFDVRALDYLLKPVDEQRFAAALGRVREQRRQKDAAAWRARVEGVLGALGGEDAGGAAQVTRPSGAAEGPPAGAPEAEPAPPDAGYAERVLVKLDDRMVIVPVGRIDWIEAYGNYVRLHVGKTVYLMRERLSRFEQRLRPREFARIHRSAIVRLDAVRDMKPWFSGDYLVYLVDGTQLKLSRGYRERLEEALKL
jgi:two-component system LytT family response regulator